MLFCEKFCLSHICIADMKAGPKGVNKTQFRSMGDSRFIRRSFLQDFTQLSFILVNYTDIFTRCHSRFLFNLGHQTTQYLNLTDRFSGNKIFFFGYFTH